MSVNPERLRGWMEQEKSAEMRRIAGELRMRGGSSGAEPSLRGSPDPRLAAAVEAYRKAHLRLPWWRRVRYESRFVNDLVAYWGRHGDLDALLRDSDFVWLLKEVARRLLGGCWPPTIIRNMRREWTCVKSLGPRTTGGTFPSVNGTEGYLTPEEVAALLRSVSVRYAVRFSFVGVLVFLLALGAFWVALHALRK